MIMLKKTGMGLMLTLFMVGAAVPNAVVAMFALSIESTAIVPGAVMGLFAVLLTLYMADHNKGKQWFTLLPVAVVFLASSAFGIDTLIMTSIMAGLIFAGYAFYGIWILCCREFDAKKPALNV